MAFGNILTPRDLCYLFYFESSCFIFLIQLLVRLIFFLHYQQLLATWLRRLIVWLQFLSATNWWR